MSAGTDTVPSLKAPFPYFGGKSLVAGAVWERFGDVPNYIEPFVGSAAVLLARPHAHQWWQRMETISDADGYLANFWRAVQADPDGVAREADWPINENDLHARHAWLVGQGPSLVLRLEGNPDFYDVRIAGWWVWGLCSWIGGGWCTGQGPWRPVDGELVREGSRREGPPVSVRRQLPMLGSGSGINRTRPHMSNAGMGIHRSLPRIGDGGTGINRRAEHLADGICPTCGDGTAQAWATHLRDVMHHLSDRLRRVRVASGDWTRVCGRAVTDHGRACGVFLDPPYAHNTDGGRRDSRLYREEMPLTDEVRRWALERGDDPRFRIALCCYAGEHDAHMPDTWTRYSWRGRSGYAGQRKDGVNANREREVIWFSPHCLPGGEDPAG